MPSIDLVVESEIPSTARVRQLEAMFDVPRTTKSKIRFKGELPIETFDWNVGLIVGPSGAGKSTIANNVFGNRESLTWGAGSVVDDFDSALSMDDISKVCQAVGFNTIPAWMRPYAVLSTGERFRVEIARRLLEDSDPIVVDEFTSVVDRQIAKIGSHAVQKFVRRNGRRFVAVTCHYDVIEWLQPDWIFEPSTMELTRREVQRRPSIEVGIQRVNYAMWRVFAPFHYLTAKLNRSAACFALFCEGRVAAFSGNLHRPHASTRNVVGCSRLVTLPDWQGLGLAFVLVDALGAAYKTVGKLFHTYPAHPALIRAFDRSTAWAMQKRPSTYRPKGKTSTIAKSWQQGMRPNATFRYVGTAMEDRDAAERLLAG